MCKGNKGNTYPRTENQKRIASYNLIVNNPLYKKENQLKQKLRMLGRKPIAPFKIGNKFGCLRKGKKHTEQSKVLIGIAQLNHEPYEAQQILARYIMWNFNPMKKPGVV